jgi:Family of unknown function (DUF6338)
VIPNSVFGLLVVAASLGPGYLFVRIAELRTPRPARSALLEVAELVAVGGSCSAVALLVALLVARWTGKIDLHAFSKGGTEYTLTHPVPVFTLLLGVLAGSYLLAAIATLVFHRKAPASLRAHSVWHELMRHQAAGRPFATVELRDGRVVAGPVAYYTVEQAPPDCRELALIRPIRARGDVSSAFVDVPDDRVVVRASDIVALSVKYF